MANTNEICDKFAATSFHANMITYPIQELNMPLVQASNTFTNITGTANFMPLLGALRADSFAGRFLTIMAGSIIYELPQPRPTQMNCKEASALQLWVLYISLLLTSLGSSGIRPCVVTFVADQFDMTKSSVAARSWNLFNWYYFSMGMATLTALTFVVYIQDNVGWGWGLGIPTIAMALSIIAFLVGSPLYNRIKPAGSPLVRLAQVIVAAVKKRKEVVPEDPALLYENREHDAAISLHGRLLQTNQFKWFDKAAIVTDSNATYSKPPNLWRLATVHRVEELKCIIRMFPVWAGILLFASSSHLLSFTILQVCTMNHHLSHSFHIPLASLSIFSNITMLIGLVLYERLFVPFARRFTGNPSSITCLQRMGVGYVVNILVTIVTSFVEIKRNAVASDHNLLDDPNAIIPNTVFWLAPYHLLKPKEDPEKQKKKQRRNNEEEEEEEGATCVVCDGLVFISVGHLEFLYDQSPESMRSTALALYWIAIAMGNYVGTLIVSLVHKYSGMKSNWLPDNLNMGRLECYYWLVSGIQVINLVYYVICSWLYTCKPLEEVSETCKEEVEELDGRNGHGEVELGLERNETG
ncbi:hypothetical protein ACB094_04G021800 [Castanea mollissima]